MRLVLHSQKEFAHHFRFQELIGSSNFQILLKSYGCFLQVCHKIVGFKLTAANAFCSLLPF